MYVQKPNIWNCHDLQVVILFNISLNMQDFGGAEKYRVRAINEAAQNSTLVHALLPRWS